MSEQPIPRHVFTTLLPHLRVAAAYSREIQSRIVAQPDKTEMPTGNIFATALSDADLSIQTFVEVLLLGLFPNLRFYGEEFEKTYNTKYFRAINLGAAGDYLFTLDPIDGTRFYLDGFDNYQIIVTAIDVDEYAGVLAISPAQQRYYYTLRGEGTFMGALTADFEQCQRLHVGDFQRTQTLFFGWGMEAIANRLRDRYTALYAHRDYSAARRIPTVNGLLTGELDGLGLSRGKWIDGAALAFMAQEMGYIVTDLAGQPLAPISASPNYQRSGILVGATLDVHQDLVEAAIGSV